MNTSCPGGSAPTGSRMMRTRVTPMSSSAQPVTAIEPVTPVVPVERRVERPERAGRGAVELGRQLDR